jgi:MFS family permease
MTTTTTHDAGRIVRDAATWYGYLIAALQIYLFTVQGNVIPFLQKEFVLTYGFVALHSAAMAVGSIVVGVTGARIPAMLGRRLTLWVAVGGMAFGALLLSISPGAWASIPSCLIIGLGGGIAASSVPAMMADIHGERRSQALTEQAILAYSFAVLGPVVMSICLALGLGWRTVVLTGAVFGVGLIAVFSSSHIPAATSTVTHRAEKAHLPPAFWAYWALFACTIACEFSILLWAPAYLERVIGFSAQAAATGAAGFFLGVLGGRIVLRTIVRRFDPRNILLAALLTGFVGFILYWVIGTQAAAIFGVFVLGLCVAPQYPLTMALALGASRGANDAGAARMVLAFGLAFLTAPFALGQLADRVGLAHAHLTIPVLLAAALTCLMVARTLEKRAA